jgi:ATP-dependent Zn protease
MTARFGTAIHEAGHAIVMWALGLTVGTIEIGIDGDDTRGKADLSTSDEHFPLIDRIAICYAGIEAQYVFDCPTHEGAGYGDHGKVVELLDGIPEPRAYQMREAGYARAHALILTHKAKLLRLAERLVHDGKVTADEFAMLIINN